MSDRVFQLKLAQLPSRPGTIVLGILGGLLMAGGSAQLLAGATLPCREIDRYDEACTSDFPTRWRLLGVGAAQLVLGTIMIGFTVRLSHRRHDGLRELEQATLARGVDPSLTFGLALGDPRALPSMTLRF